MIEHLKTPGHEPLIEACKENAEQIHALQRRLEKLDGIETPQWRSKVEELGR